MILRIVGVLTVTLCGICTAQMLNTHAKKSLCEARCLVRFLRFVRSEIECYGMPTPQILRRCPEEILESLGGSRAKTMAQLAKCCTLSDGECRAALQGFCAEVGRGYRDEQLTLCDYYIRLCEERVAHIGGALPARKKVNSALCVACSLALVIILF